jgi:hypothetical protein
MKWGVGRCLSLLLSIVLLGTGLTHAQMVTKTAKFRVPFEFQVGDKILPAGDYTVSQAEPNVLSLRQADAHTSITLVTRPVQTIAPAETKLVFERHDGQYQLVRIWRAQEEFGSELFRPRPRVVVARQDTTLPGSGDGSQP